jgi:hypothetical protein|tara:strand:+ start:355 stop:960 length:606 start_codon:yes stop_codon:yes gene_type:complete
MNVLTKKEITENLINLEGWQFQAWRAFVMCNEVKDFYKDLSSTKKVYLAHGFYDCIFRLSETELDAKPRFIELSVHLGENKLCKDHPFSARLAHRAIMLDNQWLLDDFEVFKESFHWLGSSLLGLSSEMNQKVKYRATKDGSGDIIAPAVMEDRYTYCDGSPLRFIDEKTNNYVTGFPLKIMPWYAEFERTRVPANLSSFT